MRQLTRNAVVTLLVAFALVSVYAAASAFWDRQGTLGFSTDYGANVRAVSPGGPAALAGIGAGDRLVLSATPFQERRYIAGAGAVVQVGAVVHVRLIHRGIARDVALTAVRAQLAQADRLSLLFECVASLIFIAVGAALILLRPSLATWGFGLYCLIVLPTANYPFRLPSASSALAAIGLYDVVQNVGVVGLLVFALEFPRPLETVWRRRIRRSVPALFVVLAAMTLYPDIANLVLGIGAKFENHALQIAFGATFGLTMYVLCDTYGRIARDERERLRWVLIGFSLGLVTNYVGNTLVFSSLIAVEPPVWFTNVLVSLNVLLPLTVAHAVVRHRVLDVNFVIGRALVYATLTTILAALFGLLDWIFGHVLDEFRMSRFIQAGISISIAFAFDRLHKRTETAIETIFFRKRRAVETRLDRLVHELPQARSAQVIERALIGEVVDALELTSAALYRHTGGETFTRTASYGWFDTDCASLDDADMLVLSLHAQKRAIKLAELPWRHDDLPGGGRTPLLAVPLDARAELTGIVLYGGHPGGGDIDPAELLLLERLAHAASVAFAELESERLRADNDLQIAKIQELDARLDELRRLQPTPWPTAATVLPNALELG